MIDLAEVGEAAMLPSRRRPYLLSVVFLSSWAAVCTADSVPGVDKVPLEPRATPSKNGESHSRASIRVNSTLVLIPVTVTDPLSRFVTGLEKEHFKLFEDKKEQEIVQFSSEDALLSVGIVFDCSGSMGNKLEKSRQAVAQFSMMANPDDEFFLVEFNDTANLVEPFTKNLEKIVNRLVFTKSKGSTALLDAIALAINQMKKAHNPRKALLVISDGGDNSSRFTETEVKNRVKEADVQLYAVGIYEPTGSRSRTSEELSGPTLLTELAEQTGGRQYAVENLNELPDIAAKIGVELRNEYILGYRPQNQEQNGK